MVKLVSPAEQPVPLGRPWCIGVNRGTFATCIFCDIVA